MESRLLGLIALVFLLGASPVQADIVYTLDSFLFPTPGITGTITTDGNTATALSAGDILNWDITESGGCSFCSFNLTPSNSSLTVVGNALTATPTALSFNFSASSAASFEFALNQPFTLQAFEACGASSPSPCTDQNGSRHFSVIGVVLIAGGLGGTSSYLAESGTTQFASASVSPSVPEPSTWAMMIVGIVGSGFLALRRRRRAAAF